MLCSASLLLIVTSTFVPVGTCLNLRTGTRARGRGRIESNKTDEGEETLPPPPPLPPPPSPFLLLSSLISSFLSPLASSFPPLPSFSASSSFASSSAAAASSTALPFPAASSSATSSSSRVRSRSFDLVTCMPLATEPKTESLAPGQRFSKTARTASRARR